MRAVGIEARRELSDVLRDAAVGRSREDALRSFAVAFRAYAIEHPGRYAASVPAPPADDEEAQAVAAAGVNVMVAVINGWGIEGDEAVYLVRVVRSALHGFVSLELGGGFGLPLDLDHSFDLLVESMVAAIDAQAAKAR